MREQKGFTMLELVLVATIISLLATLAIPNFRNANIRAKVSGAHADLTMLAVALESYYSDFHQYPSTLLDSGNSGIYALTTPVAYFRGLPTDPFTAEDKDRLPVYSYINLRELNPEGLVIVQEGQTRHTDYLLWSRGPDHKINYSDEQPAHLHEYDPTNGTTSPGDIFIIGPQ